MTWTRRIGDVRRNACRGPGHGKGRLNHTIGGNWWVEARIFGLLLTGPLLADQKYLADGEAFFGKDARKSAFFISLLFWLTLVDLLFGTAAKSSVIASLSRRSNTPSREPICTRNPVSSRTSRFSAFTSDSPRFTLPPGSVQSFNPAA